MCARCDSSAGCLACGAAGRLSAFRNETFEIPTDAGTARVPALGGLRCGACGEVFFDPRSARIYAAESDRASRLRPRAS